MRISTIQAKYMLSVYSVYSLTTFKVLFGFLQYILDNGLHRWPLESSITSHVTGCAASGPEKTDILFFTSLVQCLLLWMVKPWVFKLIHLHYPCSSIWRLSPYSHTYILSCFLWLSFFLSPVEVHTTFCFSKFRKHFKSYYCFRCLACCSAVLQEPHSLVSFPLMLLHVLKWQ